jgi:hypothetical protein
MAENRAEWVRREADRVVQQSGYTQDTEVRTQIDLNKRMSTPSPPTPGLDMSGKDGAIAGLMYFGSIAGIVLFVALFMWLKGPDSCDKTFYLKPCKLSDGRILEK